MINTVEETCQYI